MTDTNQKLIEPRTLKGFNDLMPSEALLKRRLSNILCDIFESFGFCTIETPHLEFTEVLIGDASAEIQKQLFRFTDQGGRDVTLRFDLTVPLARYVSQYKAVLGLPFKRYAIASVFRGEKPQKGRFREFTQCDFDFLGATGIGADCEVLQVVVAGLKALKFDKFCVRINNRHLMNGFAQFLGVPEKTSAIIQTIDKIDKISRQKLIEDLTQNVGLSQEQTQSVLDLLAHTPANSRGISALQKFSELHGQQPMFANEEFAQAIKDLLELGQRLLEVGIPEDCFRIDFSIARGLGYYTGTVFEAVLDEQPEFGSVCGGGRYDNLTQTFQKEQISGIGGSFGLDRLITALLERTANETSILPNPASPADVLIIVGANNTEHSTERSAARIGAQLRAAGFAVDVFPEAAKIKKQLTYAEKNGINILIFVREEGSVVVETRDGKLKQTCAISATDISPLLELMKGIK